ncbi:MAG TPA: iron ABC transporter permease [Candidatus Binatia bacterium]
MDTTQHLARRDAVAHHREFVARWFDFQSAGAIFVLVILGVLVLVPLIFMLLASLRPAGVMPLAPGAFTIQSHLQVYGGADLLPIIRNTLIYAGLGVLFALPIAFGFAFLTERTDMPLRDAMYVLMFIPMSTPVFATALGWVLLLGPRGGTINVYLRALTGSDSLEGPFNIYSLPGLIFVHVLGMVPTMWLFLTAVMRRMDPVLEEAASVAGAGRLRVLKTVTAPLMRPGVAAVAIYFFLTGLEALELPLALGPTAGIEVLSTKIFFSLVPTGDAGVNYGVPAAFGLLGLVMGVAGTMLYLHLVRQASDFAVVTGKGYRPKIIELGLWRYLALAIICLFIFIKVVLPFAVLLYASFLRFYVPPIRDYLPDMNWTLLNYQRLFDYRFFGRFFVNSLVVSLQAATLTMMLVSFIGWLVVRSPSPLSKAINLVAFMPLAIPGVISTLALFLMFVGTPLHGTLVLVTLAFIARFLAFGTRLMHSAMLQIHQELEEVSLTSGANDWQTFWRITLRLLVPAFMNGWLWVLVHAAKDFSVPLMLASAGSVVVANVIYEAFVGGHFNSSAAMLVVLITFNLVFVIAGRKWIGSALAQ